MRDNKSRQNRTHASIKNHDKIREYKNGNKIYTSRKRKKNLNKIRDYKNRKKYIRFNKIVIVKCVIIRIGNKIIYFYKNS